MFSPQCSFIYIARSTSDKFDIYLHKIERISARHNFCFASSVWRHSTCFSCQFCCVCYFVIAKLLPKLLNCCCYEYLHWFLASFFWLLFFFSPVRSCNKCFKCLLNFVSNVFMTNLLQISGERSVPQQCATARQQQLDGTAQNTN